MNFLSLRSISFFACVLATLLFFLNLYYYPVVSTDASFYLFTAKTYVTQGFKSAYIVYNWPFFPVLTGIISQVTGFSIVHAALLQAYCYFVFTVLLFVWISHELGLRGRQLWLSLFVILAFHEWTSVATNPLRDNGYYVFYFLSLYIFLRFLSSPSFFLGFAWAASIGVAGLYRSEAFAFLILIPILIFTITDLTWSRRLVSWFKLNALSFLGFGVVIFLVSRKSINISFDRFIEIKSTLLSNSFGSAAQQMQDVLAFPIHADAGFVLMAGLAILYFKLMLEAVGIGNAIGFFAAFPKNKILQSAKKKVLIGYIFVNLLLTSVYLFHWLFIVPRYYMALSLTVLLFVPFGIIYLYETWKNSHKSLKCFSTWIFYLVILCFVIQVGGTIFQIGPSKRYERKTMTWLNVHAKPTDVVFTNNKKLAYYIDAKTTGYFCQIPTSSVIAAKQTESTCFSWDTLSKKIWEGSNYLVIELAAKDDVHTEALINSVGHAPQAIFIDNRKKQKILIFKLSK